MRSARSPQPADGTLFACWFISAMWPIGSRTAAVALPWFVLSSTGSPALTGAVTFAELAPYVLARTMMGPLLDHVGPLPVLAVGGAGATAAACLVPLLHSAAVLTFPVLLAAAVLLGIVRAPADVARPALTPLVADACGRPVAQVRRTVGRVDAAATAVGLLLGGVLAATVGGVDALWGTAAALGLATCGTLALWPGLAGRRTERPEDGPAAGPDAGRLAELEKGCRVVRRDRILMAVVGITAVSALFEQAYAVVLVPVWARESGAGVDAVGLLSAALVVSALLGSRAAGSMGTRAARRTVYLGGTALLVLPRCAALALHAPWWLAVAAAAMSGFAGGALEWTLAALAVDRIPRRSAGSVRAVATATAWAALPLGGLVGGLMVGAVGLPTALWVLATIHLAIVLAPTLMTSWAFIETPVSPGEVGPRPHRRPRPRRPRPTRRARASVEA